MQPLIDHVRALPSTAKTGIILLFAAWSWFLFSIYRYFLVGEVPEKVLIAAFLSCTIIFKLTSWARVLCILGNVMAIAMNLFLAAAYLSAGPAHKGVAAFIGMVLFGASTLYLALPRTAAYYKAHTPAPHDGAGVPESSQADDSTSAQR